MKRYFVLAGLAGLLAVNLRLQAQPAHFPFLRPGLSTLLEYGTGGRVSLVVLPGNEKDGYPVKMVLGAGTSSELDNPEWGRFYVEGNTLYFGDAGTFMVPGSSSPIRMKLYSTDSKAGDRSSYFLPNDDPEENCPEDHGLFERTIVSMDETVSTKGGIFESCVHVRQVPQNEKRAVFDLYIDRDMGIVKMITTVVEGDCRNGEERKFMPLVLELVQRNP